MARLLAIVLAGLVLSACGGGGEEVAAPSPAQACSPAGARQTVSHMLGAFGDGDLDDLDRAFAQAPVFRWYSTEEPGERLDAEATRRETLRSYFERRARQKERMELMSFEFRGRSGGYAHFEYQVTREAEDLAPTAFSGRGALSCSAQRGKLAAWAMAPSS